MLVAAHDRLSTANDKLKIALETRIKSDDAGAIAEQKAAQAEVDRLEALNNTNPAIDKNVASTSNLTNAIGTGTTLVIKNNGMWIDFSNTIKESSGVIAPNTELLNKSGIALLDVSKASTTTTTAMAGTGKVFGNLRVVLPDLEEGTIKLAQAMGDAVQADIDRANSLHQVTNATTLGADAFNNFIAQAELGGKVNEDFRLRLVAFATTELHMVDVGKLTLEQLKDKINAYYGVGKAEKDQTEQEKKLADVIKNTNEAYKDEEITIAKVLQTHGLLTEKLKDKIKNEQDDRNELNQLVISTVDWTDALDGSVGGLDLVASGTAKAIMEMDEFTKSAVEGEAKTKALNEMYAELGRTMVGDLHTTIPLTTKDLTELGKTFKDGVPLAEKLAKIVEEDLTSAFETFSEVIEAATKKDFKEAWKGLELGDVGKRFKGELKDILEGMNDIARSGKAVATVISGLVVGALQGMSDKALGQGIKEIVEQFNRFKSLNPDATIVEPLIAFVNNLPTPDRAAGILAVHQKLRRFGNCTI